MIDVAQNPESLIDLPPHSDNVDMAIIATPSCTDNYYCCQDACSINERRDKTDLVTHEQIPEWNMEVDECDDECDSRDEEIDERKAEAISRLENFALSFLSQLTFAVSDTTPRKAVPNNAHDTKTVNESGSEPTLPMSRKRRITLELADRRRDTSKNEASATHAIHFPRKSRGASAKPLAHLFKVADTMHEALISGIPVTKRDIYYRDVELFKTQAVLVDDLAATFALNRADLNIRASAKGLFCGAGLSLHLHQGEVVYGSDTKASLIPVREDISRFEMDNSISWILIVEKEVSAVFQTLCTSGFVTHPSLPGPGILITGKGYPDLATRQLVRTLSDNVPETAPILALVDADAYGIDIVSVYKYGSSRMRHENETLAAARVEWIGVWATELDRMGLDRDSMIPTTLHDQKKVLAVLLVSKASSSPPAFPKALSMLRGRPAMPVKWRKELMHMLHNRRKAEIEIISSIPSRSFAQTLHVSPERPCNPIDLAARESSRQALQSSHPIVQYLSQKINSFIHS